MLENARPPAPPCHGKDEAQAPRPCRQWDVPKVARRRSSVTGLPPAEWGRFKSVGEVVEVVKNTAAAVIDVKNNMKEADYPNFPLLLLRSAYLAQALSGRLNPKLESVEAGSGHLNINHGDVQVFQLLGSGRTAKVYEGSWNGRPVAVKRMEAGKQSADMSIVRELAILSRVEHPNLVTLMGACREGSTCDVVLELCRGGSLFDLLHNSEYWIKFRQQLKIAEDVARGMAYLHGMSPMVMHRDLKSLNVLLHSPVTDERQVPVAKVTDFGMAKACPKGREGRRNSGGVGTVQWMSPELLAGGTDYAMDVDVYAYGVLLYEIMSFEPPFWDIPAAEVKPTVLRGGRPELHDAIPGPVAELIEECWAQDPKSRPAFFEVVQDLVAMRKPSKPRS